MSKTTVAILKTYFETGDIPTQAQFYELLDSFVNFVDNNVLSGNDDSVTAVFPGDQATATPLTMFTNQIDASGGTGAGVLLPEAIAGKVMYVANQYPALLNIYPSSGHYIDDFAQDAPMPVRQGDGYMFVCMRNEHWTSFKPQSSLIVPFVYLANMFQTGTDAPVASPLHNDFGGSIAWTRVSTGIYRCTCAALFTTGGTTVELTAGLDGDVQTAQYDLDDLPNSFTVSIKDNLGVLTDEAVFVVRVTSYQ